MVLNDRFGCRVVNIESFGNLSDKIDAYIDDAPPFLNALKHLCFCFFSHLFVFFSHLLVFDVDRLHLLKDEFYLIYSTAAVNLLYLCSHNILSLIHI